MEGKKRVRNQSDKDGVNETVTHEDANAVCGRKKDREKDGEKERNEEMTVEKKKKRKRERLRGREEGRKSKTLRKE